MRLIPIALLPAALLLAHATPSFAHAELQKSVPAAGATVKAAPEAVALSFSEGLEAGLCRVVVRDPAGAEVQAGAPRAVKGDPKRLLVGLAHLRPGAYTVEWHAVAVDTHASDGAFTFTVKP